MTVVKLSRLPRRFWEGNWWYWILGSSRPDTIGIPSPRSLHGGGSWPSE
jgi:membrane-associated phospholipid phosphatase